jgi:small GTP-binding protein
MTNTIISKKVCLLGDFSVGKTSLVRRFIYDRFEDKYLSTIGVKVSRKTVVVHNTDRVFDLSMLLWDMAGSEEFDRYRVSYLRGAAGAILVCDLTRPETLAHLQFFVRDLLKFNSGSQIILAANKVDLVEDPQTIPTGIEAYASSLNASCYLTSAKTGDQVETLFRHMGNLLVAHTT